jgi:hypothetical protein
MTYERVKVVTHNPFTAITAFVTIMLVLLMARKSMKQTWNGIKWHSVHASCMINSVLFQPTDDTKLTHTASYYNNMPLLICQAKCTDSRETVRMYTIS